MIFLKFVTLKSAESLVIHSLTISKCDMNQMCLEGKMIPFLVIMGLLQFCRAVSLTEKHNFP